MFVGSLKPHKNLTLILEALKKHPHFHLVLVGKMKGWEEIEHKYESLKGRLHFLGSVSDTQLTWLYTHAEALIFPSLYEGFGLPPLEAMRLGCPVLASNAASIPEVCGDAALYFDPQDPETLLAQIEQFPSLKKELVLAGVQRSSAYTWEIIAKNHQNLFETTLNKAFI